MSQILAGAPHYASFPSQELNLVKGVRPKGNQTFRKDRAAAAKNSRCNRSRDHGLSRPSKHEPELPSGNELRELMPESAKLGRVQAPSWTQTGVSSGMMPISQIQSIAGTLTRTQPCEAG